MENLVFRFLVLSFWRVGGRGWTFSGLDFFNADAESERGGRTGVFLRVGGRTGVDGFGWTSLGGRGVWVDGLGGRVWVAEFGWTSLGGRVWVDEFGWTSLGGRVWVDGAVGRAKDSRSVR